MPSAFTIWGSARGCLGSPLMLENPSLLNMRNMRPGGGAARRGMTKRSAALSPAPHPAASSPTATVPSAPPRNRAFTRAPRTLRPRARQRASTLPRSRSSFTRAPRGYRGTDRSHEHRDATASGIAGSAEHVSLTLGGLDAAEEQVEGAKANDASVIAQLLQVDSGLGEYDAVLEVNARSIHRRAHLHSVVDDADDRLQERRANAVGSGAAQHQLDLSPTHDDRRSHHARHTPAGRMAMKAERVEVLLAHDVVEMDARSRHDDPGALAVGARRATRHSVGVDDRDVGGGAQARGEETLQKAALVEAFDKRRRALGLSGGHRGDHFGEPRGGRAAIE